MERIQRSLFKVEEIVMQELVEGGELGVGFEKEGSLVERLLMKQIWVIVWGDLRGGGW